MMEEEPESAKPEEGKAQDGECHPPPSIEMRLCQELSCGRGDGEVKGNPDLVMQEPLQYKDKRMKAAGSRSIFPCFPSQETLKGTRRLKRRPLMTK